MGSEWGRKVTEMGQGTDKGGKRRERKEGRSYHDNPPPGCANYGQKDIVWKLRKSLYGLKQALQAWYTKAKDELKKLSFTCLNSDHAVFVHSSNSKFCIIALYVNDLMILSNDLSSLQKKKKQLMSTSKMKDLGKIHWFLGLEITQDHPQCLLSISQL